jgi:two-component system, chemotaxis family, response regulator Rcp1
MHWREPRKTAELLIVEDNPGDVRLLEEVFRELQADVHLTIAQDGAEALKVVAAAAFGPKKRPDLILLDLNLPKVSGHEVLSRLKGSPLTVCIPVIVLTSSKAEDDVKRAYDSHVNAYMKKPSTLEGLLSAAEDITNFWLRTATLPS